MNLRSALSIYRIEGPRNPKGNSAGDMAAKVVQAHLQPEELAELARLWKNTNSRFEFREKLKQVEERLASMGYL